MSSFWMVDVVEAVHRARNGENVYENDALLPVARVIRTGQAINSSNWLAAIALAIWDTILFEGCFSTYQFLNVFRPLTFPMHLAFAMIYSQGKLLSSIYRYASRDSADDEEGLILGSNMIWLVLYMGGAYICHNIVTCFWFVWNTSRTILPFSLLVLLILGIWRHLGGRPLRYIQLALSISLRTLHSLMGYVIFYAKILTPFVILSIYGAWIRISSSDGNSLRNIPPYTHDPLWSNRCIRLLKLSRRFPFGPVQYELQVHGIDSRPVYEAISYTWGDPSLSQSIIISGCRLYITSNAFEVLQNRATFWKERTIWIDSICINQADKTEKSAQIPLMREIYGKASRVLVWLGSRPDSRIAMGFIANLNRRLRFDGLQGSELKTILGIGSKSSKWPALFSLLNHPYWTRSWVIQEIAVADKVDIYYGGSIITFEYFSSTIEMLHTQDVGGLFIVSHTQVVPRSMPFRGTECIRQISRIRSTIQQQRSMMLIELLYSSTKSDATEAKDKIFAFLGLADELAQMSLSGMYNHEVQEIYICTMRYLLSQQEPSRFLHNAGIGHHRKTKNLPSWTADIQSPPGPRSFWRNPEEAPPYRASGVTTFQLNSHSTNSIIQIKGQIIDEIERCGMMWSNQSMDDTTSLFEKARERVLVIDDVSLLATQIEGKSGPYCNGQSRDEALWRTLIGDRGDGYHPAPYHYRESYEAAMRIVAASRQTLLSDDRILSSAGLGNTLGSVYPGLSQEYLLARIKADDVLARKFWNAVGGGLNGRRFAVSKSKAYFLLVPELARPGDLICIFWGTQTPFLVRPVGEDGMNEETGRTFQLVGECYVHGIMDGEAVSYTGSETFTLA